MTDEKRVWHLFTDAERERFAEAFAAKNREELAQHGRLMVLDEAVILMGERFVAAQLKKAMTYAGLDEFAARINPEDYPVSDETRHLWDREGLRSPGDDGGHQ